MDTGSPYFTELSSLMFKAFGPVCVVGAELRGLAGVEEAWLFGSWARRYLGEEGAAPVDIDLLVVGRPDMDDLAAATTRAGSTLGRPVGVTILSREEWAGAATGFVRAVRDGARVRVVGADA